MRNVFLLPLLYAHVGKITSDSISLRNFLQERRLTSRLLCTKNTSKLCSACSRGFFCFFFPQQKLLQFHRALEHMPPIILHTKKKKRKSETSSRVECIQKSIIQYAAHCISPSWGVNNIKRASAGFNANTIIHSARLGAHGDGENIARGESTSRWEKPFSLP